MRLGKNILSLLFVLVISAQCAFSADVWTNDLRRFFTNNSAIIYEINIRTFGAKDINKNGIIDFDEGEKSGDFLNAITRLNELSQKGINTIHVMPITPVGKTKALGTAGSLYAASSFNSINPQLIDKESKLSPKAQVEKFVNAAHAQKIRLIVDLPSCGAYDLYLERPELFLKDKAGQALVPSDWTDVRLLNSGTQEEVNTQVYNMYKEFVDMVINLGFDGIRADVATIKPEKFWKDLIDYSRTKDPQFLWLAEASESWTESVGNIFTPYDKLLEAGFDGYYGSFFNLKNFKSGKELINLVHSTNAILDKYSEPKAVIGSFATHDEMSPILTKGPGFSTMIIWLNATLPVNSYFVDGFDTGDNYIYMWGNKEARQTFTDDDNYFVHRGKVDIFNFSRQPGSDNDDILMNFIMANAFKKRFAQLINNGKFIPLKTNMEDVFGYSMSYDKKSIVVLGNLNYRKNAEAVISVPRVSEKTSVTPVKIENIPVISRGKIQTKLNPGEVQVLYLSDFEIK